MRLSPLLSFNEKVIMMFLTQIECLCASHDMLPVMTSLKNNNVPNNQGHSTDAVILSGHADLANKELTLFKWV